MTNDRHPDKRRALDAVAPPEQWDDIVTRSSGPEVVELADRADRSGRSRWIAGAVAAAVLLVVGAVAVLAFQGGDDGEEGGIVADGPAGFWGSQWQLHSVTTGSATETVADLLGDAPTPSLDLTVEGTVGYRGCNSGSGPVRFEGDHLVLDGGIAMTEMACVDPSGEQLMDLDARIGTLLSSGPTVGIDGDRLVLTSPEGSATFLRVEENGPASMFGRRWSATSVTIDGEQQDLHAAGGLVLQFEGEEASFPGVNCWPPYAGPLDGDSWSPVATATYDCAVQPDDRRDWLTRLLVDPSVGDDSAGSQPVTVERLRESLTLSRGGIAVEFFESQDPNGLIGTTWTVDRAVDDDVELTLLPDEGADHVGFGIRSEDVEGETLTYAWFDGGCNGVGGNGGLTFDGDRLIPGAVGSREKACTGADGQARMDQDEWFAALLRAEPLVLFQGDRLVLWTNDAGIELSREVDPDEPVSSPPNTSPSGTPGSEPGSSGSTSGAEPVVPAVPTEFWGVRWAVTAVEDEDGTWTPDPIIDGLYPVIDASEVDRVTVAACNRWQVDARLIDGVLTAGSSAISTLAECSSSEIDRILGDTLTAGLRTVGFVDDIGPGWRIETETTALVLREQGAFTVVRRGCAANDASTLEVYLGEDAGPGAVVVTLLADGREVERRTAPPNQDWSEPLVFGWSGRWTGDETLSVASVDDPGTSRLTRSTEEPSPGFGCG